MKDQVAKTVQSDLSQMGDRCELDMNNIVTASLEDLSPEEQQKFKALKEYMQVQFLAGVKKDRSGKVARLKDFELPAIRLNDSNIEVIPAVSNPRLKLLLRNLQWVVMSCLFLTLLV
jgi:hypothetical protein